MNSANRYPSIGEPPKCSLKSKPSIGVVRIHLFCLFGYGIIMSLWAWTRESVESWKSFFYRLCEPAEKNAEELKKYQLMAKAFQRQHEINQGRISFSLNSTYDDPVGMNLDANSVASKDITSSLAAALPHFLARRNAVVGALPVLPRQYSSVSDMSRHRSLDSFNQTNLDSLSMQISEQEYARHQRRKTRKERERGHMANRIARGFTVNRRGSDTSLQSSLVQVRKACVAAKVTKATSTGDLGIIHPSGLAMFSPVNGMMLPVNNCPNIQRQAVNHPFTHGMTDNSHRLDSRVPSVSSPLPGVNSIQRFTPSQCSVLTNSVMGMIRQPMYVESYDVLNSMPYGYVGGNMYPSVNGMHQGYHYNINYIYNPYNTMPYAFTPCGNQFQPDILPMSPIQDSASETDFPSIRITDSDFTDTGMRSCDEFMTTARLIEEHLQAKAAAAAADAAAQGAQSQPKPGLEKQACAKTQFLKKMGSFNKKTNSAGSQISRPPSGRKSPHSEAPPPSPVESSRSSNEDELDDVFDDEEPPQKNASITSLPHTSETKNVFEKIKSRFRRATSFIHSLEKSDTFELSSKAYHSSLGQLSQMNPSLQYCKSQKGVLKEKWLHASEGVSLMNGDLASENISR